MLVSNPPVNSHQLTNKLNSSASLTSSLPTSFSTTSLTKINPSRWTVNDVQEWLIKNDLSDCIDLICLQYRMDGQRLMNLKEEDVLQLKGTNKNRQLWIEIKKLQQLYSSNYNFWSQQSTTFQNHSLPVTPQNYFPPTPTSSQTSIPLRPILSSTQVRTSLPSVTTPQTLVPLSSSTSISIPLQQIQASTSHTSILLNQNQQEQSDPSVISSTNQMQLTAPTTLNLERSPLTITRSTNSQRNSRRSSSHSLSTSNASINILPSSSSSTVQRPTNSLLNSHHTPAEQIEDQLITGCCFFLKIRSDRKKTLSACLLALSTLYFCSFIITIVDERLPDPKDFRPLPDLVLDNVKQIPWAFSVTEKIMLIEVVTLITIILLHRHR